MTSIITTQHTLNIISTAPVSSVNGQTGTVVLTTAQVGESGSLYFTDARARSAISGTGPVSFNQSTGVISMAAASASVNGYLSAADYAAFAAKAEPLGYTPLSTTGGTLTGDLNMGGTRRVTNLATPSANTDAATKGYVDSGLALKVSTSDLGALGSLNEVTSSQILNDTITNSDISPSAAIVDTKLATITSAGKVSGNAINSGTISGSTSLNVTGSITTTGNVTLNNAAEMRLGDGDGSNYVALKSPTTVGANVTYTLPTTDGSPGMILSTSGTGTLSWVAQTSGVVTSVASKTGAVTLNTNDVTETGSNVYFSNARARAALSGSAPISYNTSTGVIDIGYANSVSPGIISAADWVTFNGKQPIIGYTTLNKAGDSMTGSLSMSSNRITSLGEPTLATDAATRNYVDNAVSGLAVMSSLGSLATKNAVGSSDITDGTIADADISGSAAITDGKLATITTQGKVSGNAISTGTIGGTTVIDTRGSISSSGNIVATSFGSTRSDLRLNNSSNTAYVGFKAPGTLAANKVWELPNADGSSGQVLQTDGSGVLSWVSNTAGSITSITAGTGLSGGTITSTGTLSLATANLSPGSFTRATVTVDSYGRVTTASSGGLISLTADVQNTLPISNGGTNSNTALNNNRIMVSSGGAIVEASALTNGQLLIGSTGAAPVAATITTDPTKPLTIAQGAGTLSISAPQDISASASPTFANITVPTLAPFTGTVSSPVVRATRTMVVGEDGSGAAGITGALRGADTTGVADTSGRDLAIAAGNGTGTGGSGSIIFRTAPSASSSSTANTMADRMTIIKSGNVGIGVSSPVAKLEVNGDIKVGSSGVACSAANEGSFRYNSSVQATQYCNGTEWTTLDSVTPAGTVQSFAQASAPSGWLTANGSAVSRSTYASLFSAIGTTYGAGDGSTTFNVPNLGNLHESFQYYRIRITNGSGSAGQVSIGDVAFRTWGSVGYQSPSSTSLSLSSTGSCTLADLTDNSCSTLCTTGSNTYGTGAPYTETSAQYVQINFGYPVALAGYKVSTCGSGISKPDTMYLQGSSDGLTWKTISGSTITSGSSSTAPSVEGFNNVGVYGIKQ